jgi:type IV pilus assembly protein PilK
MAIDVIFCRNVLVYFRRWRRKEILQALIKYVKFAGILVIELGEVTDWTCVNLKRVANDRVQASVKCS